MGNVLDDFKKNKDFLICVDSDGCAMDTMDIKHIKCFGPCMIKEWNLEKWKDSILDRWNEINLYTMTRGINRFKGLAIALLEIDSKYKKIDGINEFIRWTNETTELSNEALELEIERNISDNICIKKALEWSRAVNKSINLLKDEEKNPFKGVNEALKKASGFADIAIVSSANRQAVLEEWEKHDLLQYVDIVLTQDVGSKAFCIGNLTEKGYSRDNILMVGDALGDYNAAKLNEVLYYPILVKRENESWTRFYNEIINKFIEKTYKKLYQDEVILEFKENLSSN